MDTLTQTLRRSLGRCRFGLYVRSGDGGKPVLRSSSLRWTPPANLAPVLEDAAAWKSPLPGKPLPLPARPGRSPASPAKRGVFLLPIGDEEGVAAILAFGATSSGPHPLGSARGRESIAAAIASRLRAETCGRAHRELASVHEILLSSLPLGVILIDSAGKVLDLSPEAEKVLGFRRGEAIGSDCLRVFRPAGIGENPLLLGLKGKATRAELYLLDRDGSEKPVWVQMQRIPPGAGESADGLLVLLRDTSEERAFEEDRRRRERLASIGELSAGVAHEIRNPLTGIGNCAQVLRDRIAREDPMQRLVQIILDEATRLNRIVDSLLSYARPGQPRLRQEEIHGILMRVLEIEGERMRRLGISVELKARGRVPAIHIDPEQITQVLLNVFRNAVEAMPDGGHLAVESSVIRRRPHLRRGIGQRKSDRIRYDREAPLKRYLQIRVRDTGKGISKEALGRIFDPFFTTRSKGTGLGLSISQSIIMEHGGFITVHSIENKGTTVMIDLPIERREGERRKANG